MTRGQMVRLARALKNDYNQEFFDCIKDLVVHPKVQEMKLYPHHCKASCFQHCMNVAYYNFQICRFFGLNARAAARAGMIHDLFLYDWHTHAKETGNFFHGVTHPKAALKNAMKYFDLSPVEKDIILSHMFPVTPIPPKTKEGWVITLTDKYCGMCEITDLISEKFFPSRPHLPQVVIDQLEKISFFR